jgi:hypothetical protein
MIIDLMNLAYNKKRLNNNEVVFTLLSQEEFMDRNLKKIDNINKKHYMFLIEIINGDTKPELEENNQRMYYMSSNKGEYLKVIDGAGYISDFRCFTGDIFYISPNTEYTIEGKCTFVRVPLEF